MDKTLVRLRGQYGKMPDLSAGVPVDIAEIKGL
jgi:hypothetical protein